MKKKLHTIEYLMEKYNIKENDGDYIQCSEWSNVINKRMLPMFGTIVELKRGTINFTHSYDVRYDGTPWVICKEWVDDRPVYENIDSFHYKAKGWWILTEWIKEIKGYPKESITDKVFDTLLESL